MEYLSKIVKRDGPQTWKGASLAQLVAMVIIPKSKNEEKDDGREVLVK